MSDATTIDASRAALPAELDAEGRAYLVVREGARTQVIDLDDGADVLFGRSAEATVRLDDTKASREHARFVRRGRSIQLVELGSRNGTRLNDEVVRGEARPLRSGDLVSIGAAEILVAESAGATGRGASGRLEPVLARLLEAGGAALLVRLVLTPAQLERLSPILAGTELLEAQAAGEYACVVEDAPAAAGLLASIKRLAPEVAPLVARAPDEGSTADELWRKAGGQARGGGGAVGSGSGAATVAAGSPGRKVGTAAAAALSGVVVADPAMVRVFELVRKVAAAPTTVLVLGETGAGKEVIAEQIHRQSGRAAGPFVRLNCGSLPETLLESELFGHEKGAFTGAERRKVGYIEAADGGTLFLDEIGELALAMQTRLLRFLEDRKFMRVGSREEIAADVRIVAATNRDLAVEAQAGRFRPDLYFRLSAFVLRIPPLRERPGEVELLAELFARQFARRMAAAPPTLAPGAMALLRRHAWPGNVRELRNAIEHAVVLAEGGVIDVEQLPDWLRQAAPTEASAGITASGSMRDQLAEIERKAMQDALDAEHGNQTRAARRLGISRRALLYKIEKYGLKG